MYSLIGSMPNQYRTLLVLTRHRNHNRTFGGKSTFAYTAKNWLHFIYTTTTTTQCSTFSRFQQKTGRKFSRNRFQGAVECGGGFSRPLLPLMWPCHRGRRRVRGAACQCQSAPSHSLSLFLSLPHHRRCHLPFQLQENARLSFQPECAGWARRNHHCQPSTVPEAAAVKIADRLERRDTRGGGKISQRNRGHTGHTAGENASSAT